MCNITTFLFNANNNKDLLFSLAEIKSNFIYKKWFCALRNLYN